MTTTPARPATTRTAGPDQGAAAAADPADPQVIHAPIPPTAEGTTAPRPADPGPVASTDPADPADPQVARAAVEALLRGRLSALEEQWQALDGGHGAGADVVLGSDDLPRLLSDLVLGGGKRLRPLMAHWGWVAAGGAARGEDPAPVHAVGAALELLHAFGLAQDDVMDASTLRRGRPAVHCAAAERHRHAGGSDDPDRYGESVAVLVGDLAHAEADAVVADLPPAVRLLWWRTTVELVRGQARDLSGAARAEAADALARAREVAHAKSGAYTVQRPLQLGAAVAGASAPLLDLLGEHGRLVGEAFAMRDDLLGVFGDPEVTGKPDGDDLRSAKATVLLALVEERATGDAADAVARMRRHRHDQHDVDVVRRAMVELGVRDDAERHIHAAVAEATALLDTDLVHPDAVAGLRGLADRVARRSA